MEISFADIKQNLTKRDYKICGIYFLFLDSEVVYVGQSIDVLYRLNGHRAKKWNYFSYMEVAEEELNLVEKKMIKKFKPRYNRRK